MEEKMGRREKFFLAFNKPYTIPGLEPIGCSFLKSCSIIIWCDFSLVRITHTLFS